MTDQGYSTGAELFGAESGGVLSEDMETLRGARIHVRGITRTQLLDLRKLLAGKNPEDFEPTLLAMGLVTPAIDKYQARNWAAKAPAGEIDAVVEKIYDLSGMGDDAGKAAYKSVRE